MTNYKKNLLVLFNTGSLDDAAIKKEKEWLVDISPITGSNEQFCIANELVDRNRITSSPKKILKESRHYRLRAFRFLINKN